MPGKYYEELSVGERMTHAARHTISQEENRAFCEMTHNTQPLHLDEVFAAQTPFGRPIVNGLLTLGVVVGLSVEDLTAGTIVANLGYDNVQHPTPAFPGDSIRAETEVLDKRESKSKPDRGIVRLRQTGFNQKDEVVVDLERTVMFLKKPRGAQ
ncbi:MAG: MaoC family dehydratase [Chloroflexi bacterium]|nr:MaoC family dehydratase [Chloroflexota bacterium]